MATEEMWKEMLGTLKDISEYLEKSEVINQERAKVDKPVKAQVTPEPITGGPAAPNKPSAGVAKSIEEKEYLSIPDLPKRQATEEIDSEGSTMLKAAKASKDDEESNETEESSSGEDSESSEPTDKDDTQELKSILKDIRSALVDQTAVIKSEIKKALPDVLKSEMPRYMDKMLRKEGFHPSRPDVVKFSPTSGLDTVSEVKKSEDERVEGDIKKSNDPRNELVQAIDTLEKMDWHKLGQLREKAGLFNPFNR